jgi:hypothetical protein
LTPSADLTLDAGTLYAAISDIEVAELGLR